MVLIGLICLMGEPFGSPKVGGRLIGLIRLMGLIGPLCLMGEPFGSPPLGRGGGGLVI